MKKRRIIRCQVFILVGLLFVSCSREEQPVHYSSLVMGTFCDLTFIPVPGTNPGNIADAVFSRMRYLESLWSFYRPESEISRLNRGSSIKSSPETRSLLKNAREISRISDGAFDITVAPLMSAWRKAEKSGKSSDLKPLLPLVGYQNLKIAEDGTVWFTKKGMAVDLGGIGKGAAVDEAVSLLKSYGVKSGIVNLGGNLYAFGDGPHQGKWKVGIRNPRGEGVIGAVLIKDRGVSTSGNYQRYFEIKGKRYSHILNPKTGALEGNYPESVTVVAPTATMADGLSTAFTVLGPEKALTLAKEIPGVEALIVMPGSVFYKTEGFLTLVEKESKIKF